MRGFRNTLGISGRPFVTNILILFTVWAVLFNSGCAGLVSAPSGGGNPGPLTISNVAAANATPTSVGIDWQTSAVANSQVEYGTTTSYGSMTALDSTMVTSHQLTVSSLKPGTAYHCRVHSTDAQNISAVSGDLACPTPKDTTPPTVSITSPVANAALSGTVTVTANASDDVAVASVQFKVDSANTGAAITAAPYNYALNTITLADGNHILTAVATDTSGNSATSAGVAVKVNNTAPAPTITSLSPTSGLVGASVTISGANFGATQGTSTVTFSGVVAAATSWSASSIVVPVPAGATTGNVVVTVGGVASNGASFTVTIPVPSITSLNPTSGVAGTSVTISGVNFGATQGTSTVKFNGIAATPTSWSVTSIVVPVPAGATTGATTGSVVVTVSGVASNGMSFRVTAPGPSVTSLNPASGSVGTSVTISGANFGATQGVSTVTFNGTSATPTSWSATSIVVPAPAGATTGNVVVTVGGVPSNGASFTVTIPAPSITSLNPTSGVAGTSVTISGVNFGATQGTSTVKFNGIPATPTSWSVTSIVVPVPAGATTGNVVVTVAGVASNGMSFTVTAPGPSVTSLNPASGSVGTSVTISGANFGATQGTSSVTFNGATATPTSWSATSIVVPVPAGATTGNVVVTVGGIASNGVSFTVTVPAPSITSLSPTSGLVGTSVTISGANFGATQGASTVTFNGTTATPTSWSATSIVVPVPAGATTGNVVVTVGGVPSNGASFTVTIPAPSITSLNPTSGLVGVPVTITGTSFGATQGTSSVTFNGTTATPTSWSATSIVVPVPTGATTGSVVVTVGGVPSNGASFTVNSTGTGATGPLRPLASNAHYFTDGSGKAILLTGSQTWDTFQDLDMSTSPAAFDFTAYVNFLKSHGHNVTILWRKDLPTYCGWGAGGTWHIKQFPWKRTGGSGGNQVASDGLPAFDLTQLDQTYFDRLRARVIQLQQNGIYAIVELFDGLGITVNRCSTDGYPFTGGNNVNGVDDGGGTNSMTMGSPNTITNYQDAFVQKVIDTVNDQPNVLWEISEEAPDNSTWWQGHMIALMHTYEAGKPFQHPVGYPTLNVSGASDATLYNSNADWVAPAARISPTSSCGSGTPACKVNINDSDHSYFGMWNDSAQTNRNFVWQNFANGDSAMFMDPYLIYWASGNRNLCQSPSNGVCTGPDARWNNMRDNLGYTLAYANKMDLAKMTPQGNLSSTGYCLADNVPIGAEYLVYAPNGGTVTVNLSVTTRVLNVEWFDPSTGATTSGGKVTGGTTKSFTPPFGSDAVLYIVDAAGHN